MNERLIGDPGETQVLPPPRRYRGHLDQALFLIPLDSLREVDKWKAQDRGKGLQREEGANMFRTMLVEDNLGMRQVVKNSLESQFPFIDIIEASDGVEAFQKIDFDPPHLIFMDIGLPGENGLELTRRIKIKYPDITIIILSSYDSPEYRETAIRHKANFFLAKSSSTLDDVCRLVEAILLGEGFNADGSAPQR